MEQIKSWQKYKLEKCLVLYINLFLPYDSGTYPIEMHLYVHQKIGTKIFRAQSFTRWSQTENNLKFI